MMFCLNVGDSLPALFDDTANAELMMLRESMPESRRGFAMGDLLAPCKFVHGTEERGEFVVAVCDGEARWSIGVERPEQKRKHRGPYASEKQSDGPAEGGMPGNRRGTDTADKDDLDEQAG